MCFLFFRSSLFMNASHAALGNFWGHQKRFDCVDVEIVVDGVRRKLAVCNTRTVEWICVEKAIDGRHFNVTVRCDGMRLWRRRYNRRVGGERWLCGVDLFESRVLIDKLIVLKTFKPASFKWNTFEILRKILRKSWRCHLSIRSPHRHRSSMLMSRNSDCYTLSLLRATDDSP